MNAIFPSRKKVRKVTQRPEQDLHRNEAEFLAVTSHTRFYWATIPNGGYRSHVEAAIFKGLGVKSGVADILVIGPQGRAYWIELKAAKGRQSDSQKAFEREMRQLHTPYEICRSVAEVHNALKAWGLA